MWRIVVLLLAVLLTVFVLAISSIPLGVPGEWVWPRQALPQGLAEVLDRLTIPVLIACLLVGFCGFAERRFFRASWAVRMLYLGLLVVVSLAWQNGVRQAATSPHRELRPLWVLYDKYASGYFHEAVFRTSSQRELLSTYEARMAKGDVLHEGTHPPGLLLLNWWTTRATESSEKLTQLGEWMVSDESQRVFREMERQGQIARPLSRTEFAALCLMSFASSLLSAMTLLPVYGLVSLLSDPRNGWRAACLMVTIPSLAVFSPRSDIVYAFSGTMILWLIVLAMLSESWGFRMCYSLLAGSLIFVAFTISLAHIPVVIAAGIFSLLLVRGPNGISWQRLLTSSGITMLVFLLAVFCWDFINDCNLLKIWRLNLANHESFYKQSPRIWWKWLLENPVELGFSVGLPLAFTATASIVQALRVGRTTSGVNDRMNVAGFKLLLALLATWAALWLSGKNMGESARLWCFLTPWVVVVASFYKSAGYDSGTNPELVLQRIPTLSYDFRGWLYLLVSQLIVGIVTVGGVSGYLELT